MMDEDTKRTCFLSEEEVFSDEEETMLVKYGNDEDTTPHQSKEMLKDWLLSPENFTHPYPSEKEKRRMCKDTGLNPKQLKDWFSNARRRIWKPIFKLILASVDLESILADAKRNFAQKRKTSSAASYPPSKMLKTDIESRDTVHDKQEVPLLGKFEPKKESSVSFPKNNEQTRSTLPCNYSVKVDDSDDYNTPPTITRNLNEDDLRITFTLPEKKMLRGLSAVKSKKIKNRFVSFGRRKSCRFPAPETIKMSLKSNVSNSIGKDYNNPDYQTMCDNVKNFNSSSNTPKSIKPLQTQPPSIYKQDLQKCLQPERTPSISAPQAKESIQNFFEIQEKDFMDKDMSFDLQLNSSFNENNAPTDFFNLSFIFDGVAEAAPPTTVPQYSSMSALLIADQLQPPPSAFNYNSELASNNAPNPQEDSVLEAFLREL